MKILILARGVPHRRDPQEGCFEMDQAIALSNLGHEVVIMSVDGRFRKYWRKLGIKKTSNKGVNAYKLFVFPTSVIKRLISYKLGYKINAFLAKRLYKYVVSQHGNFDIIHAHFLPCIYSASSIKKVNPDIKIVGTEHWSKVGQKVLSTEVKYLGNASYTFLDKLIAVSRELGDNIRSNFGVESDVVYNLIDTTFLDKVKAKRSSTAYTIVALGSLIKRKGFDVLIKAFAKSGLAEKGVILKIIGEGRERASLTELVNKHGLRDSVVMTGQLDKERVYSELKSSDLYVLSSRLENFSVAIIEATACGLPAIATLCGGVAEFPLKDVIKIQPDNVDEMASAILKAYSEKDSVDNDRIKRECLSYFSPLAIGKQLENIYKSIL